VLYDIEWPTVTEVSFFLLCMGYFYLPVESSDSLYNTSRGHLGSEVLYGRCADCATERGLREGKRQVLQILFVCLFVYCFTFHSRIFHLYGDVITAGEGLQNLALCSRPLSREGSLSCHTCCDTGPQPFRSHSKDRPIQLPLMTRKVILIQILTGPSAVEGYFVLLYSVRTCMSVLR
jgi:hypothetical protein